MEKILANEFDKAFNILEKSFPEDEIRTFDEQKELLIDYLKRILTYDEKTGKYYNIKDKADWVMVWWKK